MIRGMLVILGIVALLIGAVLAPSFPLDQDDFVVTLELQGDESFFRYDGAELKIDGAVTRLLFGRRTVVGTATIEDMELQLTNYGRTGGEFVLEMTGYDDDTVVGLINRGYLHLEEAILDMPESGTVRLTIDEEEDAETFTAIFHR